MIDPTDRHMDPMYFGVAARLIGMTMLCMDDEEGRGNTAAHSDRWFTEACEEQGLEPGKLAAAIAIVACIPPYRMTTDTDELLANLKSMAEFFGDPVTLEGIAEIGMAEIESFLGEH